MQYAFNAAQLLEECMEQLQQVIDKEETSSRSGDTSLYDLKEALAGVELLLIDFLRSQTKREAQKSSYATIQAANQTCKSLSSYVDFLKSIKRAREAEPRDFDTGRPHCYYPRRSTTDSQLFRLNVALQLCLLRIHDARALAVSRRRGENSSAGDFPWLPLAAGVFGTATFFCIRRREIQRNRFPPWIMTVIKAGSSLLALHCANKTWRSVWIKSKLNRSIVEIEAWSQQWELVQCTPPPLPSSSQGDIQTSSVLAEGDECNEDILIDSWRSRRLIEYTLHETPKTSFWHSQGEVRFLMLKRFMDVFYTSVGTAMDFTHTSKDIGPQNTNWRLVLITAAAASFYSLTGANPSALVASQSETTAELIRNAWGMVSLPSIKGISLQACRLLKGAAVADRVEICGVSCFVLSSDPSPELAAAIKRKRRMHQRRKPISTLSTIDEDSEHAPADTVRHSKPFARSPNTRYRQRDVIFHLTGGGFFAHIIASDLPYLLDWSARTGAVVICPEYALLPEHRFPDALYEVEDVYKALVSDEAVGILGFETNRVVVTGESAGGNLAAALCVKLGMDNSGIPTSLSDEDNKRLQCNEHDIQDMDEKDLNAVSTSSRMPDALMLSCPVLNLTLETSHSRVVGTNDPVLPSGLISAISDAYLPSTLGISKKDPMASPFYAPDDVLRQFPPSLLFASSTNDPLLDDSVAFTKRLWTNGVEADLIAAQNLPHAYLGLGTAGFPDAQQIQEKCVSWLSQKLTTSFKN